MNEELLLALEREYGIPSIMKTEDVATGVLSSNWILHSGDTRYFLKRYRYPERVRVESVHRVKAHFSAAGIPVIMPLVTRSGETCYTHEDGRHFALFPYIVATETVRGALSDMSVASMGEMLAKLHRAGQDVKLVGDLPTIRTWDREEFKQRADQLLDHISSIETPTPFDIQALQDLKEKYVFVENNQITFESLNLPSDHLLHGDFLNHNLFFDVHGYVSHVFDWEKAGYGPRAYELVRTVLLGLADGELTPEYARQAALFMRSYREVYPISSDEISRGITMLHTKSMHGTWIQKEHYFLNNHRADKYFQIEYDRNTYLFEQRAQLEAILL